ncbi:hypothetical protein OPLHCY645_18130 [Clostridium tetani]
MIMACIDGYNNSTSKEFLAAGSFFIILSISYFKFLNINFPPYNGINKKLHLKNRDEVVSFVFHSTYKLGLE